MNIEISQIITQVVAFLIVLWIMKKFAWKPFLNILDTSQKKIQDEFDLIASQKKEVSKLFDEYHEKQRRIDAEAKMKMQEFIRAGSDRAKEIEHIAHKKAVQILNNAEEQSKRIRLKMKNQINEQIVVVGTQLAEALIKEKMDGKMQNKFVDDFLKKVEI